VPESYIPECGRIGTGDLVTYRSIKDFTNENYQQKIIIHGIGIVVAVDDEYAKVYWLHAQQFLWVIIAKLTTFASSGA
jgi:hypothetical protein